MKIVWSSFSGRYSDNPRAVYEELVRRGRDDLRHVWLSHSAHADGFPVGLRTVPYGTPECIAELESADVVVSNTHLEPEWTKAPGSVYLQTWHGTPLKHLHFDSLWSVPGAVDHLTHDVRRWDALLSPNALSTASFRRAFRFTGEIFEGGYPRNDLLQSPGQDDIRERVRKELGIADGVTAVLYTPTWRDDVRADDGEPDFDLRLDVQKFAERLGDDHVLLLRLHYILSGRLTGLDVPGVLDVSFHPDIAELYLAADAMVTDYSSTMFDFAVTGKPMVFFAYDLLDYRDRLRGFYLDYEAIAPGPVLLTGDEVFDALADLPGVEDDHRDAYDSFRREFCSLEDGRASARFVDHYFPVQP